MGGGAEKRRERGGCGGGQLHPQRLLLIPGKDELGERGQGRRGKEFFPPSILAEKNPISSPFPSHASLDPDPGSNLLLHILFFISLGEDAKNFCPGIKWVMQIFVLAVVLSLSSALYVRMGPHPRTFHPLILRLSWAYASHCFNNYLSSLV